MNVAKVKDGLNYFSKLTVGKIWNMILLRVSYLVSVSMRKPIYWGLPESTAIEPTTSCNLRCPECPSGLRSFTRDTGMLTKETFESAINDIKSHLTYLTLYFQGEPYLNPHFLDFVDYANRNKVYTATSTNAHYLDSEMSRKTVESGLDRLIISIDGTTQETYESYRIGGTLAKVVEGTKNIVAAKKKLNSSKPYVIFQFLVVKPNEHQMGEARQLADDLGVDEIKFKTAQIYDYENGSNLIPTIDYYSRYEKQKEGNYKLKSSQKNHCWRMWHSNVVSWDGDVIPCCFDKDASHPQGNLTQKSMSHILKDTPSKGFKTSLFKNRSNIEICRNCSEGVGIFK